MATASITQARPGNQPRFYELWGEECMICSDPDVDFYVQRPTCHPQCQAMECILCNMKGRLNDPRCPFCRNPEPLIPRERPGQILLSRRKERAAREIWAECFQRLGGGEILSRYGQEDVDALQAVTIIARATKIPILFMDPLDAGAIHDDKNLAMAFTKAHLDLYELYATDPAMPPLEEIPQQDWNLQEGWGSGWEAGWGTLYFRNPIVLPPGVGYQYGGGYLLIPLRHHFNILH